MYRICSILLIIASVMTAPFVQSENDFGAEEGLNYHNQLREQHNAEPLIYDETLAINAQVHAEGCIYKRTGPGQNLFGAYGPGQLDQPLRMAIDTWYREREQYNFESPQSYTDFRKIKDVARFAQLVYKSTTNIGCARQLCSDLVSDDGEKMGKGVLIVCHYDPPMRPPHLLSNVEDQKDSRQPSVDDHVTTETYDDYVQHIHDIPSVSIDGTYPTVSHCNEPDDEDDDDDDSTQTQPGFPGLKIIPDDSAAEEQAAEVMGCDSNNSTRGKDKDKEAQEAQQGEEEGGNEEEGEEEGNEEEEEEEEDDGNGHDTERRVRLRSSGGGAEADDRGRDGVVDDDGTSLTSDTHGSDATTTRSEPYEAEPSEISNPIQ